MAKVHACYKPSSRTALGEHWPKNLTVWTKRSVVCYKKAKGLMFSKYGPEQALFIRDLLHDYFRKNLNKNVVGLKIPWSSTITRNLAVFAKPFV